MKHELKLDVRFWDGVKSGEKNFEIRKNDRDFQVGDTLEMKAIGRDEVSTWFLKKVPLPDWHDPNKPHHEHHGWQYADSETDVATITAKVTEVIDTPYFNYNCTDSKGMGYMPKVIKVLRDYFHAEKLPDGYVVLGIEVVNND